MTQTRQGTCAFVECGEVFDIKPLGQHRKFCCRRCQETHNRRKRGKKPRSWVPVDPFRDRFIALRERDGLTAQEVALRLGWQAAGTMRGRPDGSRVLRTLGMKPYYLSRGYGASVRQNVTVPTAERLCRVLDLDPFEVGI